MIGPCMCGGCHRCYPSSFCRRCDDEVDGPDGLCAKCAEALDYEQEAREIALDYLDEEEP